MSEQLRANYDRWLRMEEAKLDAQNDLKEFFAEMKSAGYEPKPLRAAFRLKAMSADEVTKRDEHDALVDLYLAGLNGTGSATRAGARRAPDPLAPEQKATPGHIAEPAPRQEQAGTDLNEPATAADVAGDYLSEPVAAGQGQIVREGGAPRETGRRSGGGASRPDADSPKAPVTPVPKPTEPRADDKRTAPARENPSDEDEGIPTWLQRGHPDCVVREQGRG